MRLIGRPVALSASVLRRSPLMGTDQRSIRTSQRVFRRRWYGQVKDNFVSIHTILLHRRLHPGRFFRVNISGSHRRDSRLCARTQQAPSPVHLDGDVGDHPAQDQAL